VRVTRALVTETKTAMETVVRAMARATICNSDEEGEGKGGKRDGHSDKEGNGEDGKGNGGGGKVATVTMRLIALFVTHHSNCRRHPSCQPLPLPCSSA
jgi:hypothetical protein